MSITTLLRLVTILLLIAVGVVYFYNGTGALFQAIMFIMLFTALSGSITAKKEMKSDSNGK